MFADATRPFWAGFVRFLSDPHVMTAAARHNCCIRDCVVSIEDGRTVCRLRNINATMTLRTRSGCANV